jgi:signal transduction histidine kinase
MPGTGTELDARRRAERRITTEQAALLAATVVCAVAVSDESQWARPELLVLLLGVALATDRMAVAIGELRVSMVDSGIVIAAVIAGPAPGVLIAGLVLLLDAYLSRLPRHVVFANLAANCAPALIAGVIVMYAIDVDLATPGAGSYLIVVAIASAVYKALNLALLIYARGIVGHSRHDQVRNTVIPLLPWEAVGLAINAATAHIYVTVGIEAVVALVVVLLFFRLLLDNIAAAEQRQREIARIAAERERYLQEALKAEERERARIAAELHDDTLQTLLSARADLVDGLDGDHARFAEARDAVTAAVSKLRDLMVRLGPAPGTEDDVAGTIHGLAERIGRRAGFETDIAIDPAIAHTTDALVVGIVRELLTNVAKHARATHVGVSVAPAPDGAVLVEVVDDGVGFDPVARAAAQGDGHVGLALIEQRAASRAGALDIRERPGGGTIASVRLEGAHLAQVR